MPTSKPDSPRTGLVTPFTQRGAGSDYIIENAGDEKFRAYKAGDLFPRMEFDFFNPDIKIGNGTIPPTSIIGGVGPGGNGLPVYNLVTAYHVDNTGVADASAPTNQAISDAHTAGGGIVFAPVGTYSVQSADIVLLQGVWFLTESFDGVNFVDNRSSGSTFRVRGASQGSPVARVKIENVRVTGSNAGTNTRKAFELQWAQRCALVNCEAANSGFGTYVSGSVGCRVECRYVNCGSINGSGAAGFNCVDDSTHHSESINTAGSEYVDCYDVDAVVTGTGSFRPDNISIIESRFACGQIRGARIRLTVTTDCRVTGNNVYAAGFASGFSTPSMLVSVADSQGAIVLRNRFTVSAAVVAACIDLDARAASQADVTVMGNKLTATAALTVGMVQWRNTAPNYNLRGTDIDNDIVTDTNSNVVLVGYPNTVSRTQIHGVMNAREYGCIGDGIAFDGLKLAAFLVRMRVEGRHGEIPAGTYLSQSDAGTFVQLVCDGSVGPAGQRILTGAGDGTTKIVTNVANGVDGFGNPVSHISFLNCDKSNSIDMDGIAFQGASPGDIGTINPNHAAIAKTMGFGIDVPNRSVITNCSARGYYAGLVVDGLTPDGTGTRGTDHHTLDQVIVEECRLGLYVRRNTGASGAGSTATADFTWRNLNIGRCQWAGIVASDDGYIRDATLDTVHIANIAYSFLKEGVDGTAPTEPIFLGDIMFVRTKAEGSGNYAMLDQSGLASVSNINGLFEIHGIEINGGKTHKAVANDHTYKPWSGSAARTAGEMTITGAPAGILERLFSGTTAHTSTTITGVSPPVSSGDVGLPISGSAIKPGTTISAQSVGGTTITLSQATAAIGAVGAGTALVIGAGIGVADHLAVSSDADRTFVDVAIVTQILSATSFKAKAGGQTKTLALKAFSSGDGATGGSNPIQVDVSNPVNVQSQDIGMTVAITGPGVLGVIDTVDFHAQTFTLAVAAPYSSGAANGVLSLPDAAGPVAITFGKIGAMRLGDVLGISSWNIDVQHDGSTTNTRTSLWWDFNSYQNATINLSTDIDDFPAIDCRQGVNFTDNAVIRRGDMICHLRGAKASFLRGQALQDVGTGGVRIKAHGGSPPYAGIARGADGGLVAAVNADLTTVRPVVCVQQGGPTFLTAFSSEGGGLYAESSSIAAGNYLCLSTTVDGAVAAWDGTTGGKFIIAKAKSVPAIDVAANLRCDAELIPLTIS